MHLTEDQLEAIRKLARASGVRAVYLFGSVLDDSVEPADIDIAVEGAPAEAFFRFYAKLESLFSKPVDLVDLDSHTHVTDLIARRALKIYG